MKINPVGIQSYQQVPKRDENAAGVPYRDEAASVSIEPKNASLASTVSVKAKSGDYAETLSTEERRALELVFARFKETGRFGRVDGEKIESGLGQLIDVKV